MVFTALLVEGGVALGVAAVLAAWSRRHFAPRTDAPSIEQIND